MEIDVNKCPYKGGLECHIRDYPIEYCADVRIEDCHYKQLQRYKQAIEEIEKIAKEAGNTEYMTFPDFDLKINAKMLMGQFNRYLAKIIQKCEEVNE